MAVIYKVSLDILHLFLTCIGDIICQRLIRERILTVNDTDGILGTVQFSINNLTSRFPTVWTTLVELIIILIRSSYMS